MAKFCDECGASVAGSTTPLDANKASTQDLFQARKATDSRPPIDDETVLLHPVTDGERRQLTVLFCDMVGFTELASRIDPEILQEVVRRYEDTCAACITRYEGYVYQRLGDGIVAFFGYPLAHEGEAERAIHAGLAIIDALATLSVPNVGGIEVRIGIATGVVVVAAAEKGAVGEPMNLAARLQGVAQAGSIAISERVRRLAGGAFTYRDLGLQTLKGITQPTRAYRVEGVSDSVSRFEAATQTGLTPLVGREEEIALLIARWKSAQDGEGQVVLVGGEPGIGKSRVLSALREQLESQRANSFYFQCSPYHTHSALYPCIDNFERALKFGRDEPADAKINRLEGLIIGRYGCDREDVRFVAAMLSLPVERYGPLNISPQRFKDETLRVLADLVEIAANKQPTVMLFEDAHWADPTSLEVLDLLIDRARTIPLLMVITHRPEFQSRWGNHGHVSALNLSKLTKGETSAIVDRLANGKSLPGDLLEQILSKTDGVPLFVEELTKSVLQSDNIRDAGDHYEYAGNVTAVALPITLRDSLMARLDRYAPIKEIAQIGAAIGRTFTYELIKAVAPRPQYELDLALGQLTESELAFRRGTPPDAVYTFKHALVQDAAYESLLKSRRLELHAKIARVIEERFRKLVDTEPELLAHHYTAAGLAEPAIAYWLKAAKRAATRSAHRDTFAHLDHAFALLKDAPSEEARRRLGLQIELQRAAELFVTKGMSAPETGAAYDRARELCDQLGDDVEEILSALFGIYVFHLVRGNADQSVSAAEEAWRRANRIPTTARLLLANRVIGASLVQRGELVAATEHLEQAINQYEPLRDRESALIYGSDLRAVSLAWLSKAAVLRGRPEHALACAQEAIRHAESLNNYHGVALALGFMALVHRVRREPALAREVAQRGMDLSKTHGFQMWHTIAGADYGAALVEAGEVKVGVAMLEEYFSDAKTTGLRLNQTSYLAALALGASKLSHWGEAICLLDDAIAQGEELGERWYEAELYRLKGEFIFAQLGTAATERATACFSKALEIARAQSAKTWELRTATSLARLWKVDGKLQEALALLIPVVDSFSEGLEMSDFKDARRLIEELSNIRLQVE